MEGINVTYDVVNNIIEFQNMWNKRKIKLQNKNKVCVKIHAMWEDI